MDPVLSTGNSAYTAIEVGGAEFSWQAEQWDSRIVIVQPFGALRKTTCLAAVWE
jgi:hypothetical protein